MKHRNTLLTILLFCTSLFSKANDSTLEKVRAFIRDLSDDKVGYEIIIKKHLCVIDDQRREERINMLTQQLASLREQLNIIGKQSSCTIKNYKNISLKEQDVLIDENEERNIYSVASGGKFICFVWVKDGKIASFSTMNKGGKRVFLEICS